MLYLSLAACFGWVATACLFAYVLIRLHSQQATERDELRTEIRMAQTEMASLVRAHAEQLERLVESRREEVAALHQARVEEIANLCQRIQAPEAATMEHASRNAGPDPAPLDIEDDSALLANREAMLRQFGVLPEYVIEEVE